jgi:PadR family transcriptional regulator, regulatory protein PadR
MPRLSPQTLRVLERFIERPTAWRYGYELSRETGLKAGTLYPILMSLAKFALLEAKWITTEDGVPPRHTYRLTANGMKLARAKQTTARSGVRVHRTALSGGKA